jgi:ACR3 family arsenite efflux pump ArsB
MAIAPAPNIGQALTATIGPLVEVLVLVALVYAFEGG